MSGEGLSNSMEGNCPPGALGLASEGYSEG